MLTWTIRLRTTTVHFFYHCEWLLRQYESGHFLTYGHFMWRPTAFHCRTPDLYWHFVTVYMTYQFKRNPNTIPVSKIICTCTTIFLKFYNKCVNKNDYLATIYGHVNIFFITSYFTLQQVKVSIEIVFGSQLTRKDDNVINIF